MRKPPIRSTLEQAALKLTWGTGVILVGTVLGQFLALGTRVLIARNFSVYEFGLLSLGLAVLALARPLAVLGFTGSVTRYVAYHHSRHDQVGLRSVIIVSLTLTSCLSLLLGIGMWTAAAVICQWLDAQNLEPVLHILAFSLPCTAISVVLVSIFRGFGRIRESVALDFLLINGLRVASILVIVLVGASFLWVVWAYLLVSVVQVVVFLIYAQHQLGKLFSFSPGLWSNAKELLLFSLPLMGGGLVSTVGRQVDSVLLAYFISPREVGLYGIALLLASIIGTLHSAMAFLFLPAASRLVALVQLDQLQALYSFVTKWVVVVSFPIAAILFILPGRSLGLVFGDNYRTGAVALQILVAAHFFHIWLGPNGITLTALGNPREVFRGTFMSALLALGLCLILIPVWHLTGAAVASAAALITLNLYISRRLYQLHLVHPFSIQFVGMGLLMIGAVVIGIILDAAISPTSAFSLVAAVAILGLFSFTALWVTGGFDDIDRVLWNRVWAAAKRGR